MKVAKRGVGDGDLFEFVNMVVDTTTGRTYQVLGKIGHFIVEIHVQSLHVGKFRGEVVFSLQRLEEIFVQTSDSDAISGNY